MYIKKTASRYKDKTYTNYLLVEAISTPKGPRHKVICSLGDLRPRPAKEWLRLARKVEAALVGQMSLDETDPEVDAIVAKVRASKRGPEGEPRRPSADDGALVSVHTDRVTTERHREAGTVHVGHRMWESLAIARSLEFPPRTGRSSSCPAQSPRGDRDGQW